MVRESRGRVVEEGGSLAALESPLSAWTRRSVEVSHQRGGRLPRLPVGPSRHSEARGRTDDPVWQSQLLSCYLGSCDLGECAA